MATQAGHDALRVALMDRIYDGSANALVRKSTVVHATMGAVVDQLAGASYPLAVFHEVKSPDFLALFARRGAALLAAAPARAVDFPDATQVRDMGAMTPKAAAALTALATQLEAV